MNLKNLKNLFSSLLLRLRVILGVATGDQSESSASGVFLLWAVGRSGLVDFGG